MSSSLPRAPASGGPAPIASVVAETLPRCRTEGARVGIPGDDVVAGDAMIVGDALLLGVVRRDGTKRLASIVRASLDLGTITVVDVGAALGDDPPPSPRLRGTGAIVAAYVRPKAAANAPANAPAAPTDAGPSATWLSRVLELSRFEGGALTSEARIVQQADESLAYDVAWPLDAVAAASADKPGIVAWDEDAPPPAGSSVADRGIVKVQVLGASGRTRVASPDTTDAEAPRLLARRGGYWLVWLARRAEAGEDAGSAAEAPGEKRAYRWVELVALDAKGEATSPVRRVSPEKGRVASFDLATMPAANGDAQLVVVVQDEAAHAEGAGERIVRYAIEGEKLDGADLLDGGVGHALAELLPASADAAAPRWLAFSDLQEHAHLAPLGPSLRLSAGPTLEPSLDNTRIVTSTADVVFAVGPASGSDASGGRLELRRLICR